ncbi:MAG: hypothetical protein IK088_01880 [Lachnospiraceae bacterium]|nr:hypothetical protein [Lachnospiraceae bacterium]
MITTIKGEIDQKELKYILPHEHLFSDLRPLVAPLDDEDFGKKLSLANYGKVSRNPYAVLDNAFLEGEDVQTYELKEFKKAGGSLIADVTTDDFGRDIQALRRVSDASGVPIVVGCGHYTDASIPEEVKALSVAELREEILNDLLVGIGGTDMRAGVIGEIGTSDQMTEFEKKSLRAASEAQAETGFGMHIHASLWTREGLNALKYAVSCGADPGKVCVDHADVLLDEEYIMGVLELGAYIEFDDFGKEYYVDRRNRNLLLGSFATDRERVRFIRKLLDRGYEKQILITNDICLKSMLHTYGGWGYDHIITNIVPMMEDFGIEPGTIDMIVRKNPVRFLERN